MPTDWQNDSRSHDREKLASAREAAEALFKPTRPSEDHAVPDAGPTTSSAAEGPGRAPRVFAMPQAPHVKSLSDEEREPLAPLAPTPKSKRPGPKRRSTAVPESNHARIRTLVMYGMSREQVAEHYEVGIGEIERILAAKLRAP